MVRHALSARDSGLGCSDIVAVLVDAICDMESECPDLGYVTGERCA